MKNLLLFIVNLLWFKRESIKKRLAKEVILLFSGVIVLILTLAYTFIFNARADFLLRKENQKKEALEMHSQELSFGVEQDDNLRKIKNNIFNLENSKYYFSESYWKSLLKRYKRPPINWPTSSNESLHPSIIRIFFPKSGDKLVYNNIRWYYLFLYPIRISVFVLYWIFLSILWAFKTLKTN